MGANETDIAMLGMVLSFATPLLLVAIILYYRHRKLRITHETIAHLADKGLPVPPELLAPPRSPASGLRAGLVLIALGIGLAIFFAQARGGLWSIGLIPGLMGAALLLAWWIDKRPQR